MARFGLLFLGGLLLLPVPARALPACVALGDCDASGDITVDELVKAVNIVPGIGAAAACPAFECARGSTASECLAAAVQGALVRPSLAVDGSARVDVGGHRLNSPTRRCPTLASRRRLRSSIVLQRR